VGFTIGTSLTAVFECLRDRHQTSGSSEVWHMPRCAMSCPCTENCSMLVTHDPFRTSAIDVSLL
jgi:hypothetical protein